METKSIMSARPRGRVCGTGSKRDFGMSLSRSAAAAPRPSSRSRSRRAGARPQLRTIEINPGSLRWAGRCRHRMGGDAPCACARACAARRRALVCATRCTVAPAAAVVVSLPATGRPFSAWYHQPPRNSTCRALQSRPGPPDSAIHSAASPPPGRSARAAQTTIIFRAGFLGRGV